VADGLLASAELVTHSRWKKANLYFLSHEHGRVIWSFFKKLTRFVALTKRLLTANHGSGIGGCKILKQCYEREMNFYRGKSRICITLRGHTRDSLFLVLIMAAFGFPAPAPPRGPTVDVS
jgi:hypothetical protein